MKWIGKKFVAVAVMLFMIFGLVGCSGGKDISEDKMSRESSNQSNEDTKGDSAAELNDFELGFATPEDAVLSYLAAMRDSDYSSMEASFGGNCIVKHFSWQYAYLCGMDLIPEIAASSTVILDEREAAVELFEQITQRMEEADFGSMEFMGFVFPGDLSDSYSSEAYQDNLMIIAQNHGFSEYTNRVAAIEVNGNKYLLFFDLIKQEDRWYNFRLGGMLADMLGVDATTAGCVRLDEEDEEILEGLLEDTNRELPELKGEVEGRKTESEGFDTPWQAAAEYLKGMAAGDMDWMLGTFSIESYAKNYNLQAYMEYLQSYSYIQQSIIFPPVNALAEALVGSARKEQLERYILEQGEALYMCGCYMKGSEVTEKVSFLEWEEVADKMDLGSIEVVGYILPEELSDDFDSEEISSQLDRQAQVYGAEQVQECVIVFAYEDEKYCLFMEAAKYNGKWYNSMFGNRLAMLLGLHSAYMGTVPLEAIEESANLEEAINYI